jgi:hypothetical protein
MKSFILSIAVYSIALTTCQAGESRPLFARNLSNAEGTSMWTFEDDALTASADRCIWTDREYENFVLDLDFKTAESSNSGVIVYCSNMKEWIPNSVEIQILDDYGKEWQKADDKWKCGAIFGRLAPCSLP